MTIFDLQQKTGEEMKSIISKMSREEITEVIKSCGTSQGKAAIKRTWESLTGKNYNPQKG